MVRSLLLVAFVSFLAFARSAPQGGRNVQNGSLNQFSLGNSIMKFHSKFYSQLTQKNFGNIFYSPFSIHMLVTQLLLGSPVNSVSHMELANLLEFDKDPRYLDAYKSYTIGQELQLKNLNQGSTIRIANTMYSAEGWDIKQNFTDALKNYFLSDMNIVNFADGESVAQKINRFVQNKTNNLIQKLFEPEDFDENTRLVLLNAIYFKGSWKYQFDKTETRQSVFHVDETRQTNFSAMQISADVKTIHHFGLKAKVLELPYQNEKTSMVVILPDSDVSIQEVESRLENFDLKTFFFNLSSAIPTEAVSIVLPKFETEFNVEEMKEMLINLGVASIFDPSTANFSKISNDPNLFVSQISHKAIVKVNEEGSEAAAVTGAGIGLKSYDELKYFTVNRPFLFFIVDVDNKLPLFAGRIVDPNGKLSLAPPELPGMPSAPPAQGTSFASPRSVDGPATATTDYPCIHLGYFPTDPALVSYPCPGHDTLNVELHNAGQVETRKKLEDYNEQINSFNITPN